MNPEKLKLLQEQVRIGGKVKHSGAQTARHSLELLEHSNSVTDKFVGAERVKGTARRKKKVVHRTATTDDKKLQSSLKKLSVNNIPGIEEVNMIKEDGQVIHFNNPKVQASLQANTFAITGHAETKQIAEMLPGILNQLGAESLSSLKKLASTVAGAGAGDVSKPSTDDIDEDDDGVPDLVENFDEASKGEGV